MGVKRAPFYQIDAFIRVPFKANPAVICMIPVDLEDDLYVTTAKEMNLSETAFLQKQSEGEY